jgi:hypothetical protein
MYYNISSPSVIGPVVPALSSAPNMTQVYVFWVIDWIDHGLRILWGFLGLNQVFSCLDFGVCAGSQCLTLFGVSDLTCLLHFLCLGPCRCMLGVLEPFRSIYGFQWIIILKALIGH